MALESLDLLDKFKQAPFVSGYPPSIRSFYSPVDDVSAVLTNLLKSATKSIVLAMFGFDDLGLSDILREKLESEHVYTQISLDSTQAGGKSEQAILVTWHNDGPGNSIAIGQSAKHAISHLKECVIDGLDVLTGSTNWSLGGETRQDNALVIVRDANVAAEARTRLDFIHNEMLRQMAAKAKTA